MTPPASTALAPPPTTSVPGTGLPVAPDEFSLDLRVIQSPAALSVVRCATDDSCGSTCAPSACASGSNDPS